MILFVMTQRVNYFQLEMQVYITKVFKCKEHPLRTKTIHPFIYVTTDLYSSSSNNDPMI